MNTDYYTAWAAGDGVDAISSASVILDTPSGNYVVLINTSFHTDEEALTDWVTFFAGGEIGLLFEDISCSVATVDTGAISMAESLQSRLPEHQMTLQKENQTLLLSRMEHGKFDVVVMSKEFAEANFVDGAYGDDVVVIHIEDTD